MDQVLGVPRTNERDRTKNTINARLNRLEEQFGIVNSKLDDCLNILRMLPANKNDTSSQQIALIAQEII